MGGISGLTSVVRMVVMCVWCVCVWCKVGGTSEMCC